MQKYGASYWTGDVSANWEEFRAQIPAGLNFCMTGIPYWTTDIAGYFINTSQAGGFQMEYLKKARKIKVSMNYTPDGFNLQHFVRCFGHMALISPVNHGLSSLRIR